MRNWTRRRVLGGTVAGCAIIASPALAQIGLRAPKGKMRLSRRLERNLSDGAQIVVARIWEVQFSERGSNLAIEGKQIGVEVKVPENLDQIAAIERNRSTGDRFPILLGPDGLILSVNESDETGDIARAIHMAEDLMARSKASNDKQQQFRTYLSQIQASANSLFDQMPPDLFFPRSNGFNVTRPVNLPDGTRGEFQVDYAVTSQADTGLLKRATRKIITRVGTTEQTSSEHWSLANM